MNVFGERQHPEKFIPMTIKNVKNNKTVVVHSDKLNQYQAADIIFTPMM